MGALRELDVQLAYGDITQPETLEPQLRDVEIVAHVAGIVKAKHPERFYHVNARGTENLLSACDKSGTVRRFVFVSSLAAAGPSKGKPLKEDDPPQPISAYGRSKRDAESAVVRYAAKFSTQILRPSGVYGPGDKETLTFFEAASRGVRPSLGDPGRQIQVIYIDDLCDGIIDALRHDLPSAEIYSLAEDHIYFFYELMDNIEAAVGKTGARIPLPGWLFRSMGAITQTVAPLFNQTPMLTLEKAEEILSAWSVSLDKAKSHFDFSPNIAFPEGARRTVTWYREKGWLPC